MCSSANVTTVMLVLGLFQMGILLEFLWGVVFLLVLRLFWGLLFGRLCSFLCRRFGLPARNKRWTEKTAV